MSTVVIANPVAGAGRGARVLGHARRTLAAHGVDDIRVTSAPGDAATCAQTALRDGATTLIAVGGDGTWSQVAGAIADAGSPARLALLAAGTGNDFAKTLGLPVHDVTRTLALVGSQSARSIDLGQVDGRWFLNVAGFGFDTHVLRHLRPRRGVPPTLSYALAAVRRIVTYQGFTCRIGDADAARFLAVVAANGTRFGGVFTIAPHAAIDDGALDLIAVRDTGLAGRLRVFAGATRGTHVAHARVQSSRAAAFTLEFDAPPFFQADGELFLARERRVELRVAPGALRLIAPP